MNQTKICLAFSATLLLLGCASLPSAEEAARADHGPLPTEYERIVKSYYEFTLKDPGSAQYRHISYPKQYWLGDRFTGAKFGYLVCATVNAKNSYGAYVGYKIDGLLIYNERVILHVPNGIWFGRSIC